jgi:phage protein D
MAVETLSCSVTNTSNIISCSITDSHVAPTSMAIIVAESTSLDIGDVIDVDMGYSGDTFQAFTGYVKEIELKEPEMIYTITAANVLIRAVDFFIASSTPTTPFSRQNISPEDLVEDLLNLAGLTSFASDVSNFTFAISIPVEVNLTPCYDYCRFLGDIIAFSLYADNTGTVQFRNRRPYPVPADASVYTVTDARTLDANYEKTDRDIRNKVIVYGSGNIAATASASSPYLPAGYFRTVVVAAPGVIDTQSMATQSAAYNLDLLNRLTQRMSITIAGKTGLQARQCVTVNLPDLGISGSKWYIYSIEHKLDSQGYMTILELRL